MTRLEKNWVDAKKKTYGYRETNEQLRQAFVEQLAALKNEQIVYADESSQVWIIEMTMAMATV